jgi:Fe-S cluster assembly iron-binding protein IscA
MSLIERAKIDVKTITANSNEFAVDLVLTSGLNEVLAAKGLHTDHHLAINDMNERVNVQQASVVIHESILVDYTYKNSDSEITFNNHRCEMNGVKFIVREWYPDKTVGLITLILGTFTEI